MPQFEGASFEELRAQDYMQGKNKGSSSWGGGGQSKGWGQSSSSSWGGGGSSGSSWGGGKSPGGWGQQSAPATSWGQSSSSGWGSKSSSPGWGQQSSSSGWGTQSNKGWGQQSSGGSSWGQQSSPGWGSGSSGGSSWGKAVTHSTGKSSWNSGSGASGGNTWKSGGSSPSWGAQGASSSQWGAGGAGSWGKTTGSSWGSQGSWNSQQQGPPQQPPTIQYGMVPPVPEVYIATPKESKPESTPSSLNLGTNLGTYKMTPRSAIKIKPRTSQHKEEAISRPAVSWSQDIKKLSFDSVDSTPRKSPLDEAIDFMPATPQRTPGSPKTPIRSPRSPDEGPQETTPFLKLPPVHLLDNDSRIESTPITLRFTERPEQENKPPSRIATTPLGLTYTLSDVGSVTFEQLPLSSQSKIDEGALDSLLEFDAAGKTLQVHPNKIANTETFKLLANRPALIALHEIWPLDRKTGAQLRDPTEHAATFARLARRLEQQSIEWGGEFVSYEDGTWTWRATPLFS